jgi:hypothetical protein
MTFTSILKRLPCKTIADPASLAFVDLQVRELEDISGHDKGSRASLVSLFFQHKSTHGDQVSCFLNQYQPINQSP